MVSSEEWWKCLELGSSACEYTKIHWIVYFQMVNFIACELYLKKKYFKKVVN